MQEIAANPDLPLPHREDSGQADGIANALHEGRPANRKIRQRPRLVAGDKIVTRNLNPRGHTRLPRYARGKRGVVIAHHGAHVFPDTNAHGLGENPQHLYTVRFSARELWGESAEPNERVLLDVWESYLDKDKAVSRSAAVKRPVGEKKLVAKASPKLSKIVARAASSKHSPPKPIPSSSSAAGKRKKFSLAISRGSAAGARASRKHIGKSR
jgi:Nitrile hydratase beta subunit